MSTGSRDMPTFICDWFINLSLFVISLSIAKWSRRGCKKVFENEEEVKCECDHLTNFALLMDVSQTGANPLELQVST